MYVYSINNNLYFGNRPDGGENNDRAKKVATVSGAGAAGVAAVKSPFSKFSQLSRMNQQVHEAAKDVKAAQEIVTAGKASGPVISSFGKNLERYKEAIIQFGQKCTNSPLIKSIIDSKLYRGAAGFTGGILAGCVTVAGIGNITNTVVRKADQITH